MLKKALELCQDAAFGTKRLVLGRSRARRTRLYCIGTPKSGTHSIASMFSSNVRARHEPRVLKLIEMILNWRNGRITEAQFVEWLHQRDRQMALEVDSSHVNFEILPLLLREFPDGKYLLTVRDCYSYLNSQINQTLRFRGQLDRRWAQLGEFRFGAAPYNHAPEEALLKEQNLPPLDNYFAFWAKHNTNVLALVPSDRLLVIRTHEIKQRAFEIADFAGLPRRAIRVERTHTFQNPAKQELIRQIDRAFLEEKAAKHCGPLMTRFFPEIKSLDDAKL